MDPLHVLALVVALSALLVVVAVAVGLRVAMAFFRAHAVTVLSAAGVDKASTANRAAVSARVGDERARAREALAASAWVYANRLTRKEAEKMDFAIGYARKIQQLDGGGIEFSDSEMRLAVEVHAGRNPSDEAQT